jgi:hypothetical protein
MSESPAVLHELFTTPEAADHLRLRPKTLENWRSAGVGPGYLRLGGRVAYPRGELEKFKRSCLRKTSTAVAAEVEELELLRGHGCNTQSDEEQNRSAANPGVRAVRAGVETRPASAKHPTLSARKTGAGRSA